MSNPKRPACIVSSRDVPEDAGSYPGSSELLSPSRAIGKAAGLTAIGLHLVRIAPGTRTSYPHAESREEEFAYVISGSCDVWLDGHLHRLEAGDLVGWPAGTGISHCLINDGTEDAVVLAGGSTDLPDNMIHYPLNPERREQVGARWWEPANLANKAALGPHAGLPRKRQ
jgi:uncharacterized cupin superfamily protein